MKARRRRMHLVVTMLPALAGGACGIFEPRPLGEQLWRDRCASCHGIDARGNTPRYMGNPYADLSDDLWRNAGDRDTVAEVVRSGVFGEMPANPDLTAAEMAALLGWLYDMRGEVP